MASNQRDKGRTDGQSDWWLWPSALILALSGWGQAMWMWENSRPEGIAPLWLLLWIGAGVAGLTLPVYWLARRWAPASWFATGSWLGVPWIISVARDASRLAGSADDVWYKLSPLLLLLLLGIGLSGVMTISASYAQRRWPGDPPNYRPLRQAFWAALFVITCGWLLIYRAFSLASVSLLAGGLTLFEAFLVIRESPIETKKGRRA
jgi:hypothetical protein